MSTAADDEAGPAVELLGGRVVKRIGAQTRVGAEIVVNGEDIGTSPSFLQQVEYVLRRAR